MSLEATYGESRPDIRVPGHPDAPSSVGFHWRGALPALLSGRHPLEVWAVSRDGERTLIGRRSVVAFASTPPRVADPATRPFYFLVAYSGTRYGGAKDADVEYAAYQSSTLRTGVTVPILYMRTTRGRGGRLGVRSGLRSERKCGERRLADDSLNEVIAHAIDKRLPTMFVLNGGIWADSGCDVPARDLNDHLERTPAQLPVDAGRCRVRRRSPEEPVRVDRLARARSLAHLQRLRNRRAPLQAKEPRSRPRNAIAAFANEHPELFVGVTLDADTYMNPFFDGAAVVRLQPGDACASSATGCEEPVRTRAIRAEAFPICDAHRRATPLSLADVNRLAKRNWRAWDDVDPPRRFPGSPRDALGPADTAYWDDPWFAEWDVFRKHWSRCTTRISRSGRPRPASTRDRIFTAQGFSAPYGRNRPFALRVTSTGQNYDSAGMSLEGAKPAHGHLGAILYGRAAENDIPTENGRSLFWNFARADRGLGDRRAFDRSAQPARARADLRQGVSRVPRCVQLRRAPAHRDGVERHAGIGSGQARLSRVHVVARDRRARRR